MKYKVRLHETEIYDIEVDADNRDAAVDVAWEKLCDMSEDEKESYFHDSDGDAEVFEQGE